MTDPYAETLARLDAKIKAIDKWKASLEPGPPTDPDQAEDDHLDDDEIEQLVNRLFQGEGNYQI